MKDIKKRVNLSNKIYPIFYGLSSDLIFFIAINMLFLTEIKGLTPSDINLITAIASLVALFFYLTSHKIIKIIGNINSIKLGTLLLLVAVFLYTFSKSLILIGLAQILYEVSFVFKSMDTVVLNNNLVYENKESNFVKIKTKASTIYSFSTLVASLLSGFLFNINPYIPMFICMFICLINFILAHFIYEINPIVKERIKDKTFKFSKIIIISIITFGLLYGTLAVSQNNDKLFMQYRLKEFLDLNTVTIWITIILFLSRLSRLISNLVFIKIYNKLQNKILYLLNILFVISTSCFIIGKLITNPLIGSIIMATGFILLLALRDPIENVLSNILLHNTKPEHKQEAMLYFQFSRRLVVFLLSLLATFILGKFDLLYLYLIIFTFTLIYIFIVHKLLELTKK